MMSYPNPVPAVLQLGQLNIIGNITPDPWYQHLKFDSGKPNLNAVIILSEIVYWYRPVEIRDEHTGQFVGYHQKFKGDKLQRSYQSLADKFGLTKRQARDACHFLEDKGLIDLELRTVSTASGASLGNVLFIGIDPETIAKLTYSDSDPSYGRTSQGRVKVGAMTSERKRGYGETSEVLRSNVGAMTLDRQTYTEITTETSTEISSFPPTPQGAAKLSSRSTRGNNWREKREERQLKSEESAGQTESVEYETESNLNSLADEPDCTDCLARETNPSEDRSSAPPPRNVTKHEAPLRRYDSALGIRPPQEWKSRQQRQFDWVADGPWLVDGKLDPNFVGWLAQSWQKQYGYNQHLAKANVLRHFKKDAANVAIAWEQYRSEQHHRYSNAALRMQHGQKIQPEEQQQLWAHRRAVTQQLPDEMNPVAVGQQAYPQRTLPVNAVAFPINEGGNEGGASQGCEGSRRSECSAITQTDSAPPKNEEENTLNSGAYKLWKPKSVEGETVAPEQFRAKLTELTQSLSMPQKPEREPKDELEELNQWLADPILRGEVMARVRRSELPGAALRDRYMVEYDEQGQAIGVVEV